VGLLIPPVGESANSIFLPTVVAIFFKNYYLKDYPET
jgi:hypothetical protein